MPTIRQVADVHYLSSDGTPLHWDAGRYFPISGRELTPEAFDAPLTGDASTALQNLFSEIRDGDVVRFSRLHDCSAELYTAASNITFISSNKYTLSGIRGISSGMQMVTFGGFGVLWDGPALIGNGDLNGQGAGATINGMKFLRSDGTGNVDSRILSGTFSYLDKCVTAFGRNIKITESLFSSSRLGFSLYAISGEECRGVEISGNRFHSMGGLGISSKCMEFDDRSFDCIISNNHADSIYNFYYGPVNNTVIDNNKIFKCVSEGITLIASNTEVAATLQLSGSVSFNYIYKNSPSYLLTSGISLRKLRDGRVHGNIVVGPRAHGIALYDSTSNSVVGNVVVAPGYNEDVAVFGIFGDDQSTGNILMANSVRSAGKIGLAGGISVHSNNKVEVNTVDTAYASNMYARNVPTLGLV